MRLILIIGMVSLLICSGCVGLPPGVVGSDEPPVEFGIDSALVCEMDTDCVYAINAFYSPHCVSPNCPPEENTQPQPNEEGYEWVDGFVEGCINLSKTNGKDALGEDFQFNERASCACAPVEDTPYKTCQPA